MVDVPEWLSAMPTYEPCCVVPWPSYPRAMVDPMGTNLAPIDLSDLATRCAPDPDAKPMMTAEHAAAFIPYGDRLVAVADKPTDKLRGLWLPDQRNSKFEWTLFGTVVAVGPGPRLADGTRRPLAVKVGDRIVWSYRPSREEQTMHAMFGERAILLRESEIAAAVLPDGYTCTTCGETVAGEDEEFMRDHSAQECEVVAGNVSVREP